jgi:hypothetical protein
MVANASKKVNVALDKADHKLVKRLADREKRKVRTVVSAAIQSYAARAFAAEANNTTS